MSSIYHDGIEVLARDDVLGAEYLCDVLGVGDFARAAVRDGAASAVFDDVAGAAVDVLADAVADAVVGDGVTAASIFAPILSAAGEMTGRYAAGEQEKRAVLAAGEGAWGRMKRAAEAAKWPQDLSPRVVLADKNWQAVKNSGDLVQMKSATDQMLALANEVEGRFTMGPYAGAPQYAPPSPPWPFWKKAVAAVAAVGGGVLAYKTFAKKRA